MANNVRFEDNRVEVIGAITVANEASLYEMASEILSQTQRNTPVDTGQLKNSWSYRIDESKGEATIGSPLENAIWNEYGTGEHALNGDGRKGGWKYKDRHGEWHFTRGKKPNRTLYKAFMKAKPDAEATAENEFRSRLK